MPNQPVVPNQQQPFVQNDLGNTIKYLMSSAVFHQVSTQFTNALIKDMMNTGLTIIPAEVGYINFPLFMFAELNIDIAGVYTGTAGAAWDICYGKFATFGDFGGAIPVDGKLSGASGVAPFFWMLPGRHDLNSGAPFTNVVSTLNVGGLSGIANITNQPVVLYDRWIISGGPYNGGNVNNFLKVYTLYLRFNATTRVFE